MLTLNNLADKIKTLPELLRTIFNKEGIDVGRVLVDTARANHNFTSRTGRLESSIKSRMTATGTEAYLDTGVAPYATYIHDGTKHIKPDKFLEAALDSQAIDKAIDKAIEQALTKALNRM